MSGDWLTYQEAADRLGIKPESVKKRAARRHWQRTNGNDGRTRVLVPSDSPGHVTTDIPADTSPMPVPADTREKLAAVIARADVLAAQVEDLRRDKDRLMTLLESRPVGIFWRLFGRQ